MKKILSLLLTAGAMLMTAPLVTAGDNTLQPIPLSDDDCVKCHYSIAVDVDSHGRAHKELSCQECHQEHAPTGTNTIPECSMCHPQDDSEHFGIKKCLSCHNPHKPLLVDFTTIDAALPACSTCHKEQPAELAANPSGHSVQDCNSCHNQHGLEQGQYQTCLDCHEGHSSAMTKAECLLCHAPHNPANVAYGDDVSPSLCTSCHEDIAASFKALPTLHSEMACVECHSKKHGNKAACVDCHDQPHDAFMHNKFPECITCHRDPHNLAK